MNEKMANKDQITVALAQISPIWLNRKATLEKVADYVSKAANEKAKLVVFGEALAPGYPFWVDRTNGAEFNSSIKKKSMHTTWTSQFVLKKVIWKNYVNSLNKRQSPSI